MSIPPRYGIRVRDSAGNILLDPDTNFPQLRGKINLIGGGSGGGGGTATYTDTGLSDANGRVWFFVAPYGQLSALYSYDPTTYTFTFIGGGATSLGIIYYGSY